MASEDVAPAHIVTNDEARLGLSLLPDADVVYEQAPFVTGVVQAQVQALGEEYQEREIWTASALW